MNDSKICRPFRLEGRVSWGETEPEKRNERDNKEREGWVTGDEMRRRCWRKREKRQRKIGPAMNSRGKEGKEEEEKLKGQKR